MNVTLRIGTLLATVAFLSGFTFTGCGAPGKAAVPVDTADTADTLPAFIIESGFERDTVPDWFTLPDSLPGVPDAIGHFCFADSANGFYKYFSSVGDTPFYCNSRHGYFVAIPRDMVYNQKGEYHMGCHDNEFFNADTTLVISTYALYYDVMLDDEPNFVDTVRDRHVEYLKETGICEILEQTPDCIVARVTLDQSNPETKARKFDYQLCKQILRKDIEERECEFVVSVYYNSSLADREAEFMDILRRFPDFPY